MNINEKIALLEKALSLLNYILKCKEIIQISDEELDSGALFLVMQRPEIIKRKRIAKESIILKTEEYKQTLKKLNDE